jgi:hypothetical protein
MRTFYIRLAPALDRARFFLMGTIVSQHKGQSYIKDLAGIDLLGQSTLIQLVSGLHRRQTSAPPPDPTRNWTVFSFSNCMSTPCPDEGSFMGTT